MPSLSTNMLYTTSTEKNESWIIAAITAITRVLSDLGFDKYAYSKILKLCSLRFLMEAYPVARFNGFLGGHGPKPSIDPYPDP
mmetsp:Transcript_9961/g.21057  ORF Transcript_9961/g.21057 Transcript_9961/m.21057 type:complete len:83 (-) Transcript_9961:276-524(-)